MNKTGPIIIVDDDTEDQYILNSIFEDLDYSNELIFFKDGEEVLQYLYNTEDEPFIVMTEIHMPKVNGMELRQKIFNDEYLWQKSIPYLFFTMSAEQENINEAYSKCVQGYFIKSNNYKDLKYTIRNIVEYWNNCESPDYSENAQ